MITNLKGYRVSNTWAQRSMKVLIATKKLKNELQQQIDATIV
jgi:hypothetical protein